MDRQQPEEAVKIIRHLKGFEPKFAAQLERETGLEVKASLQNAVRLQAGSEILVDRKGFRGNLVLK